MLSALRSLIVRTAMPMRWKRDPQHAARALKRFGDVEADSGWQYLQAIRVTTDHELRRMLFENVVEEFKHAGYFHQAAHSLATDRIRSVEEPRTLLINRPEDMCEFLAFAHVSEKAIHSQFNVYASSCGIPAVSDIFNNISVEEAGHESEAHKHLKRAAGSNGAASLAVWKARSKRGIEAWKRIAEPFGGLMFHVIFAVTFLVFGPLLKQRQKAAPGPLIHRDEERDERSLALSPSAIGTTAL